MRTGILAIVLITACAILDIPSLSEGGSAVMAKTRTTFRGTEVAAAEVT